MSMQQWLIAAILTACASRGPAAPPPVDPPPAEPATPTDVDREGAPAQPLPDSRPCLKNDECESGVCEGEGCGSAEPGHCAPKQCGCRRDRRDYCGCDGITFSASGSCPGRRYKARGACQAS